MPERPAASTRILLESEKEFQLKLQDVSQMRRRRMEESRIGEAAMDPAPTLYG